MKFDLAYEEVAVQELKRELEISPKRPHCVDLEIWKHTDTTKSQLQCKISVFTNDGLCIQGRGANFGDAAEEIRLQLKPKMTTVLPDTTIEIVTED